MKCREHGLEMGTYCEGCVGKGKRIAFLERKRAVTMEDMKVKMEAEDWHGVQDCASDLRDADSELDGLWPG